MSTDYEPPILYAKDARGRYRFIDDVANGDACGCSCPACGQPMRARNAGKKLRHSFAHQPGMTCTWAVEAVITMLAKQAIEESGCMALPALYYEDAVRGKAKRLSQSQIMRVVQVETADVPGRQAPCLVITVQGGAQTARFGLCVTLRRRLSAEQEASLLEGTRGIVLVDLGIDLARQRAEQGKHYDRDEIIKDYQNKDVLAGILQERASNLMSWEQNATRDEREAQSVAKKEELERRAEERRAQEQRKYEEEKRRVEEARRREAEKRAAKEAREGIVKVPDRYVTEYEEYDVRRWGDRRFIDPNARLAPYERYVANGALEALIVEKGDASGLTIRCEMRLAAIDEVSWNLDDLRAGFDSCSLALHDGILNERGASALAVDADGKTRLVLKMDARAYCCALQGLVFRGARVMVFASDGRGRIVDRVDVSSGTVLFK